MLGLLFLKPGKYPFSYANKSQNASNPLLATEQYLLYWLLYRSHSGDGTYCSIK